MLWCQVRISHLDEEFSLTCRLVFLRVLEYYSVCFNDRVKYLRLTLQGILFLTTNRVGTMDPAFRSRIHLSLYYPRLNRVASMNLWRMNIEFVKEKYAELNKDVDIDEEEIMQFAENHYDELKNSEEQTWNGR